MSCLVSCSPMRTSKNVAKAIAHVGWETTKAAAKTTWWLGKHTYRGVRTAIYMARGKEIVNPVASIESVRLMLEHLGEKDAATDIQNAVMKTLAFKKVRTADMGGNNNTFEMGDEITKAFLSL